MKLDELRKDLVIKDFFDEFSSKPNTQAHFLQSLQKYTEFTGLTPDEMLTEAEQDTKNGVLMRSRKIRRHLIDFNNYLNNSSLAPKTKKGILSDVKSFYKHHDIDVPSIKIEKARPLPENKHIPTREEVRESLRYCNIRNRAIVLCQCSGGLGSAEILDLNVGQFKEGYDADTGVTTLHITRVKTDYDYITFLSPEASKAVWNYIEDRNKKPAYTGTVRVRTQNKHKIYSDDNYLFIKEDVPNSFLKSMDDNERKLNQQGVMDAYRTIALRMGISTDKGKWQKFRSHNMRKYYNNTLRNQDADMYFVDYTMGHVVDETHAAYYKADVEKMKAKYIKYLPFLSIGETEVHVIESEEYKALKAENEEMLKFINKQQLDSEMMNESLRQMGMEFEEMQKELNLFRASQRDAIARVEEVKRKKKEQLGLKI